MVSIHVDKYMWRTYARSGRPHTDDHFPSTKTRDGYQEWLHQGKLHRMNGATRVNGKHKGNWHLYEYRLCGRLLLW